MAQNPTKFFLFFLALLIISEANVNAEQTDRIQSLLEKARQRKTTQVEGKTNSTKSLEDTTREVPNPATTTPTRDLGYQSSKVLSTVEKTPISKDVQATIQAPSKTPEIISQKATQPAEVKRATPAQIPTKSITVVNQTTKVSQPPVNKNVSKTPITTTKVSNSTINTIKPSAPPAQPPKPYTDSVSKKPEPKNTIATNSAPRPKTTLQAKRESNQAKKTTPYIQRDHKLKDDFMTSTSINLKQEKNKRPENAISKKPEAKPTKQESAKLPKLGYEDQFNKKQINKSNKNKSPKKDLSNMDSRPSNAYINTDMEHSRESLYTNDKKKTEEDLLLMLRAYKETVRNEIKSSSRNILTPANVIGIEVPKANETPEESLNNGSETLSSSVTNEQDYLLVLRKSLKSLEENSWAQVKQNMSESLDYFAREKALHPDDPNLEIYHRIVMGFSRFAEGGLELDEGDFADFEEAEAMYLDCMDILEDAKSRIKKDDVTSNNVKEIISTVIKYTDEELEYIEEMIGL